MPHRQVTNTNKVASGRRPGKSTAKKAILDCAQRQFSANGYERTTIRSIARDAKVDSALIHHYFPNKYALFLAAVLPTYAGPTLLQAALASGDVHDFGYRIAQLFYYVLDNKETQLTLLAMVRAAASEPQAAETLQKFVETMLIAPLAEYLGGPQAKLRANLLGAHLVGLFVTRYITKLEPLASASSSEIIAGLAPVIQAYISKAQ